MKPGQLHSSLVVTVGGGAVRVDGGVRRWLGVPWPVACLLAVLVVGWVLHLVWAVAASL